MNFDLSFYKGKRVFVTGHTGFKGSWLCKILANAGAIVTGYSLNPPTSPSLFEIANIEQDIHSVIGDMTSYNSFQPDDKPEDKEEEELPDIDVDEMLVQIKQSTGLCMKSILAVLEAEHKYLDSIWGTDDDDSDEEDNA